MSPLMAHRVRRYLPPVPDDDALEPVPSGATGLAHRWRAAVAALRARHEARRARRDEAAALLRLGEAMAVAPPADEGLRAALDEVAAHDSALAAAHSAVDATVREDRADYAAVASWARPLVIARGLAARGVLRAKLRQLGKERAAACRHLGAAALERSLPAPDVAAAALSETRDARVRAVTAEGQAEALLAPFGGSTLPRPVAYIGREVAAFGKPLARELRGRLVPRLPALAGLVVGWWVASTFTDSKLSATLHSFGIGSGPRRAVDSGTMRAMSFWLPILAAALCSYLGSRLGALVRARYAAAPPEATSPPPAAAPSPSTPPPPAVPAPLPSRGEASIPPSPRRGPSSPP